MPACAEWGCKIGDKRSCKLHCPVTQGPKMYPTPRRVQKLSVALLLSGDINSDHTRLAFGNGSLALPLWRQHVVHAIEAADSRNVVHAFVCSSSSKRGIQPEWSLLQGRRGAVLLVQDGGFAVATDQYSRMEACFLAAQAYEKRGTETERDEGIPQAAAANRRLILVSGQKRSHSRFTHYIRARYDLRFHAPIPLAAFDPQRVAVRARILLMANECEPVHADSVVIAGIGCGWKTPALASLVPSSGNPKILRVLVNNTKNSTKKSTKKPKPIPNYVDTRAAMRARGIPSCASLDDMFAVAPRHLGPAYFLRQGSLERSVPPELLPYGWDYALDAERSDAVRASYGSAMSYGNFSATCSPALIHFMGRASGVNASANLLRVNDQRAAGETRITQRLHARLVPFMLTPLPFSGVYGAKHGGTSSKLVGNVSKGTAFYC